MWIPAWDSRDNVDWRPRLVSVLYCTTLPETATYSDSVDYSQTQSSPLQTVPQSQDSIGGLSGLRYENGNIVPEDGSLSVKEIGC